MNDININFKKKIWIIKYKQKIPKNYIKQKYHYLKSGWHPKPNHIAGINIKEF